MAIRTTMLNLIARVRDVIGDSADDDTRAPTFSSQQIQDALDRERTDCILGDLYELAGRYSVSGGAYRWTDYFDPYGYGDWEEGATLYNGGFTAITPASSDYLTGHWVFTDQPPPVYLVGRTYDIYAAARALFYQRIAAHVAGGNAYDFSADGASFSRSQMIQQLTAQAEIFSSQMRVTTANLRRSDVRW